jgi:hypothetical protein
MWCQGYSNIPLFSTPAYGTQSTDSPGSSRVRNSGNTEVSRISKDCEPSGQSPRWCPEPDSNRHGLAAEGFSYSLQLSLLSLATHLESGLSLCHSSAPGGALKVRQGPSSLYTFPRAGGARGLSSGLQAPRSRRWGCFPEFDPIHTGCFRAGCSTLFKSLASTDFATRASGGADSKPCLGTGGARFRSSGMDIFTHGAKPLNLRDSRAK